MHSALYLGRLRHRRFAPRAHAFEYGLFMVYLDLAELGEVFRRRWLWSASRRAPLRFRREDHLGPQDVPLDEAVRRLVLARTGERPAGPIRLLTHLRCLGYCFNPVSFYYCFDRSGEVLETIVAEINNTPWGEQHCYVLPVPHPAAHPTRRPHAFRFDKAFHVSPFMPPDIGYDWRLSSPGEQLTVHMRCLRQEARIFDATLLLARRAITGRALASVLLRFPWMTAQVIVHIYWQALRLWLKRIPIYDHPRAPAGLTHTKGRP